MRPAPWLIREADPTDATALVTYMQALTHEPAETNNILLSAGEFKLSFDEEQAVIRKWRAETNSTLLVAEVSEGDQLGAIVGVASCRGRQTLVNRHVGLIGLSVTQGWRGRGLGRALMDALLDWARQNPELERLELSVFGRNTPAIRLYESLGFAHEGRRPKALKRAGEYIDELEMGLWLRH